LAESTRIDFLKLAPAAGKGKSPAAAEGRSETAQVKGMSNRRLEDADPAFLNNPEGTLERLGFERAEQGG
jgi:hypothetical protein